MEENRYIEERIAWNRFTKNLKRRKKKKRQRRIDHERFIKFKKQFKSNESYESIVNSWIPTNLSYLLSCKNSDFHIDKLKNNIPNNKGVFRVPVQFSIIDYPKESFKFLQQLTAALITQKYPVVRIDYRDCVRADLGAQVLLDIILKDIIQFYKKCNQFAMTAPSVRQIGGINVATDDIKKLLFSVGSPAIHSNNQIHFDDIIPYKLCIHDREKNGNPLKIREQKDIDTTTLVDYVLTCLKRLNKRLTPDKLYDLCTVIGEILINAEEHSTTKYRFSIGYFHEKKDSANHFGVFRLVILNFGKTIYEIFKDPNCPNQAIVEKMKKLSDNYTQKKYFFSKVFDEECLWTLYALQEGVTSVAPERYKKRGNGSIQFIESFFNIKGRTREADEISRMTILSGHTNITFDGSYDITEGQVDGENFKFMTFNKTGNIEDKPDPKYVKFVDHYFPGTIISAKILFNDDDLTDEVE